MYEIVKYECFEINLALCCLVWPVWYLRCCLAQQYLYSCKPLRLHFISVLLFPFFFSVSNLSSDPFNMHSRLCKLVKILIVCTNVYIISLNEKKNVCQPAVPVLCQLDNIQNLNFRLCIKTLARYMKQS